MSALMLQATPLKAEIRLGQAIEKFALDLTKEQRADFLATKDHARRNPPDIRHVMQLTAEIDRRIAAQAGGGRCFGTRMLNVLEAVQKFAALGDIVVGGSQNIIACGVWSIVRTTLVMLVSVSAWFEKLSELFIVIGRSAPRYEAMSLLYPQSKKLQSYLCEYFLIIVRVCHNVLKWKQKSMFSQLVSLVGESDMKGYQSDFELWASAIKEEVDLLTAQEIQEQSRLLKSLSKYSELEAHRVKVEARLRILDSVSTYDYQTPWKEIRRCGNTSWFTLQREYQDWKASTESCTLLYSGKLGSGKSIALANMVDDMHVQPEGSSLVAYFFCRHDTPKSLNSSTIMRSLARQLLCTTKEPIITPQNTAASSFPVFDEEIPGLLKQNLKPIGRAYFILDGLDECKGVEREKVIDCLKKIQAVCPLLVCLSFRQEAGNTSALYPKLFEKPTTISIPEDNPDITEFIQAELERRVGSGSLRVGEPTLILEIREALLEKAQGMFLWVALQINSLCMAQTDEAIRQALANLPKDLPSAFSRILDQSASLGKESQIRTLELITAAYRPLSTDELREALAVVPGDVDWNPTRMPNDIHAALACCGSLVIVDEETLSVKLIHHSVKQFLLSGEEGVPGQTFTIKEANFTMANIVCTYLSYAVFESQLSTTAIPRVEPKQVPTKIVRSALDSSRVQNLALKLLKSRYSSQFDVGKFLADESKLYNIQPTCHFFFRPYSESYWAKHTMHVSKLSPAMRNALLIIFERNMRNTLVRHRDALLLWATKMGDDALARSLLEKGAKGHSTLEIGRTPIMIAAEEGHVAIVQALLDKEVPHGISHSQYGQNLIMRAAKAGQVAMVQLLIDRGVDPDSSVYGETPMSVAINGGNLALVELLLDKGSNVESLFQGQTAISLAAEVGNKAMVQLLVEKGAAFDSASPSGGWPPLLWATQGGHLPVVQFLLNLGADVESRGQKLRPLSLAAYAGDIPMAQLLLKRGANFDSVDVYGQSPLSHATFGGQPAMVELLLDLGADTEIKASTGQTPLSRAAEAGHTTSAQLLLDHGADVKSSDNSGRTPLSRAFRAGHEAVVRLLLREGA